jgi:hypothetical protein
MTLLEVIQTLKSLPETEARSKFYSTEEREGRFIFSAWSYSGIPGEDRTLMFYEKIIGNHSMNGQKMGYKVISPKTYDPRNLHMPEAFSVADVLANWEEYTPATL